jgi:UDP-2,3-diacylglucosamine pyrophosphatase LpxH
VISTHIPLMTLASQVYEGPTVPNDSGLIVVNAKQVDELFKNHNLKLVLQGHLHYYEDLHVFGTSYVTAGAVSGSWWEGPYMSIEEGFLLVKVKGKEATWEYVDYGWEATN